MFNFGYIKNLYTEGCDHIELNLITDIFLEIKIIVNTVGILFIAIATCVHGL
jgi:hypothetical protein